MRRSVFTLAASTALAAIGFSAAASADTLVCFNFSFATGANPDGSVITQNFPVYVDIYANPAITSDNFLSYVSSGAYNNSFIHRSIPNFVIQGGGFAFDTPNTYNPVTTS